MAFVILVLGPLQFIPKIRIAKPGFHRWSGRIYITTLLLVSISGVYLIWVRSTVGDMIMQLGTTINALLVVVFSYFTLHNILRKQIKSHNRWTFRLFLVAGGVWFFRVLSMFWLIINRRPVWFDVNSFIGPFLYFISYGQYLIPLLVAEIYFYTRDHAGTNGKIAMASILVILTIFMGIGIFGATMGMWIPHM
jgi:hypothetical protein